MSESFEKFKETLYPETIRSQIIRFRMFGIESIDEHLNNRGWTLAHQEFNGKTIPNLVSSELSYQPATSDYKDETIVGIVIATAPRQWHQFSIEHILDDFKKYMDENATALYTFNRPRNDKCIEVFDANGICIGIIDGRRRRSEVTMIVDIELEKPDNKREYYNSVKQSVELWGYVHDFIAHSEEVDGMPMRYLKDDPQHEIYVGGARPSPTPIEMDLIKILEEVHTYDSDLPTPTLGDIDFQEVEDNASFLSTSNVIVALRKVIAENRVFYRHTKFIQPITTTDLLYAINQQQLLHQQSPDENSHRD